MNHFRHLAFTFVVCGAAACAGVDPSDTRLDGVQLATETSAETAPAQPAPEATAPVTGTNDDGVLGGTCARPIEIRPTAARFGGGSTTVFRGTTEGMPNVLHPYGRRAQSDAGEVVYAYRVPEGAQAVKITTEGSAFNTQLYVRGRCQQDEEGTDIASNDDGYDMGLQSTVYLTYVTPGQTLFIVVDGSTDQGVASGRFQLTIQDVFFGQPGTPCGNDEGPRCAPGLRCSEGATADGTDLCLHTVALGRGCDPRGFTSTCEEGATCAIDGLSIGSRLVGPVCRTAQ